MLPDLELLLTTGILAAFPGRDMGQRTRAEIGLLFSYQSDKAIVFLSYRSALLRPRSGMLSRLRCLIRSICTRIAHRETGKDTEALLGKDISR